MPHLKLLDGSTGRTYRVDATDALVGRDPNAAVAMQGDGAAVVSGRHARITLEDGAWWVEDLSSRNGTFLNGRRLTTGARQRLNVRDEIGLGATGPKLRVEEAVGRDLAATLVEPTPSVAAPARTVVERADAAPSPLAPTATSQPAVGKQAVRVLLRTGDGKRLSGEDLGVVIGRSREATIRLEGDMSLAVSRRHARVFYSGWKICIEDLGSRNGTWLNRKRVEGPTILERGDVIEFGAGGPMLTVLDVTLVSADATRRTEELKAVETDAPFVSELPTPAMDRPAFKAGGENK